MDNPGLYVYLTFPLRFSISFSVKVGAGGYHCDMIRLRRDILELISGLSNYTKLNTMRLIIKVNCRVAFT